MKGLKMSTVITKRPNGTIRVQKVFEGEEGVTMTQQQYKNECDVNHIMKKYKAGKGINHLRSSTGVYADITSFGSYQEALQKVMSARDAFQDLPSDVRNKFSNDPQKLIDFLNDEKNVEESIKLGLRVGKKVDPLVEEIKGLREDLKSKKDK